MEDAGFRVSVIDPKSAAADAKLRIGTAEAQLRVWNYSYVLEHVVCPTDFILGTLPRDRNENDILIVEVPDFELAPQDISCFIPEHIHYFSRRSLVRLFRTLGFSSLVSRPLNSVRTFGFIRAFGCRKSNSLDRQCSDSAGTATELASKFISGITSYRDAPKLMKAVITPLLSEARPVFFWGINGLLLDLIDILGPEIKWPHFVYIDSNSEKRKIFQYYGFEVKSPEEIISEVNLSIGTYDEPALFVTATSHWKQIVNAPILKLFRDKVFVLDLASSRRPLWRAAAI